MKTNALILSLGLLAGSALAASAQTTAEINNQTTTMNNLASTAGETNVVGKISNDFSSILGANANAVVTGLRNGTPITLKSIGTTPGGTPTTATTTTVITPPTGQMGYGNVYISLALAKQQLGAMGITEPTPAQLQAALTGGTITQSTGTGATATTTTTTLDGILTLRSQNMGWGQIAQKLGYKLGPVMSSMKSANQHLTHQSTSTTGSANSASNRAIVSAGGQVHGNGGHGISTTAKGSGGAIVSAAGRAGNGYGHGGGIVSGAGQSASSAGGGNGAGLGKGHSK